MSSVNSPFLSGQAKWIWTPNFDDAALKGQFVLFRREFSLDAVPSGEALLHVSADTRYRLYLNGQSISFGPCKSYLARWNYETVDIAPLLRPGKNVLAAKVLRFSSSHDGCLSMVRSSLPGFILYCELERQKLHSDESWKTIKDDSVQLVPDSEWDFRLGPQFLSLNERVDGRLAALQWNTLDYDDSAWEAAKIATPIRKMSPMLDNRRLYAREIPALTEISSRFDGVVRSDEVVPAAAWDALIKNDQKLEIPANTTHWVELESTLLTTGFLDLVCSYAGQEADAPTIEILCSECYEAPMKESTARKKGDRTDYENGALYGTSDYYTAHHGDNAYSTFWFRTFRYIRVTVTTKSSPLTLGSFTYRASHYPLEVGTKISTSSELVTKLWDTSVNTVRNCMHETYEDCPFYEQNQFAMDTRSQILFTYLLSRDDRLARKAMREFHSSRGDDGLMETHFPSPGRGMSIPTFSLFWVLMVHDHMVHFGDEALVRGYVGAVDGVLGYFADRLVPDLGLVGQFDADSWGFVDWVDGWFTPGRGFTGLAVPKAYYERGAATYHSLVYAYALLKASELQTFLGRHDTAEEYLVRQRAVLDAVRTHCYDAESKFFLDGPGAPATERSQHVQVLAVLAGCCTTDGDAVEAQDLMRRTVLEREQHGLAQASLAMSFYVFRAASEAGVYEECWPVLIEPWKRMIGDKMTTWAESESMMRSDCHGWSAAPLWEIGTEILGVRQRSRAYLERVRGEPKDASEVEVKPRKGLVSDIKADVLVGDQTSVHVEW
ncbi:Six-hairpin glycosidase-like protein [Xylariales sp. PMI_506]|nr:Six-hairpin glycosidase-like protein [Xylariales sp. PMI_506]